MGGSGDGTFLFIFISFSRFFHFSIAVDTLAPNQPFRDGDTLVSSNQRFELGFFSPSNSKNRYLGIWYKKTPDIVVWVAERNNPSTFRNGFLTVSSGGSLSLMNQTGNLIWSSNSSRVAKNAVAQLLDTGNFVIRENNSMNSENYFWQSFDYPTDTRLPGMKLGKNFDSDIDRYLCSWRSIEDPSSGEFTYRIVNNGLPQIFIFNGAIRKYRTGVWNGLRFSGVPLFITTTFAPIVNFHNNNPLTMYEPFNNEFVTRVVLNSSGLMYRYVLNEKNNEWITRTISPDYLCDNYGTCGPNAFCSSIKSPICECLQGFKPRSEQEWLSLDWTSGCVMKMPLDCKSDGFVQIKNVKLPDMLDFQLNHSMSIKECEMECLKDCSCLAYAKSNISGAGSGCLSWYGDLIDIREFIEENSPQDMYLRLPSSELESTNAPKRKTGRLLRILLVSTMAGILVSGSTLGYIIWRNRNKRKGLERKKEDLELPLFDLATIANATNNFSQENIIGEGGFGSVYKGVLSTGENIAVKRLSKTSVQGLEEFMNEVILIAKLQHRNLVRLLGCCIRGEERMLIYEFMPNKSLDHFIFDENTRGLLGWQKRCDIIMGVARGLLYLHQDSRFRIIHRDLKTSNVLLDNDLNPKISDFGLARIFEENQIEVRTRRIIGTYGYMSPEYAIDGKYSVKSDIFSFGVLLLEIVCRKSNRGFIHSQHHHNLLGHAWLLWQENKELDLVDEYLEGSFDESQARRCIQVGLLCVQKHPRDRPEMSTVVSMLGDEGVRMPSPKEPGFFNERSYIGTDLRAGAEELYSVNSMTITMLQAR